MRRRLAPLVAALVVGAVLSSCAAPLPEPTPDAVPAQAPPALGPGQLDRILSDVTSVVEQADSAALDAAAAGGDDLSATLDQIDAGLAVRLSGPAAQMRRAQYVLATQGGADAITTVPAGAQTVIDPATGGWPRVLMVVTDPPEDLRAPLLLTLVQEAPREQYRLWSWERLYGGVEMPATMQPEVGSAPVPADGGPALLTPQTVMDHYVDVLTKGDDSAYATEFTQDPLRARIAEQRDAWKAAIGKGTVTETYAPGPTGPWALETADGGAIVVGAIETVTTLTLVDSTLTLADQTAALLGTNTLKKDLAIHWLSTVAFAVPPAGSTDPVTVLGAEHVPVQVTGS